MKNQLLYLFVLILLAWGCQSEPQDDWKSLDLLAYNIPVKIKAPDSTQVESSTLGPFQDVTVKGDDGYSIQILAGEASSTDMGQLKANQLNQIKENPLFSGIINEDESGFIYKLQIDSTLASYGFRHIRQQGDKEYIFGTGIGEIFTLEQVERLYGAVQPNE